MASFQTWSWPISVVAAFVAAMSVEGLPPAGDAGAGAWQFAAENFAGPVNATVERVIDGDTLQVQAFIWLGQSLDVRVRIDGVDAPELEARCETERRLALKARDFLIQRLGGTQVHLSRIVYDKYGGRVRAAVADSTGDVAAALLTAGLVRPYHGERRQPWCVAG